MNNKIDREKKLEGLKGKGTNTWKQSGAGGVRV
jgi:hypothetical protein